MVYLLVSSTVKVRYNPLPPQLSLVYNSSQQPTTTFFNTNNLKGWTEEACFSPSSLLPKSWSSFFHSQPLGPPHNSKTTDDNCYILDVDDDADNDKKRKRKIVLQLTKNQLWDEKQEAGSE